MMNSQWLIHVLEKEVIKCRSSINCPLPWSIKHTIYYLFMLLTINISTNSTFLPTSFLDKEISQRGKLMIITNSEYA